MTSEQRRLRVAIVGSNGTSHYSGGRYHGLIMAYALARAGADVTFISNVRPIFLPDLEPIAPGGVDYVINSGFREGMPEGPFDFVIVIPRGRFLPGFYEAVASFATKVGARLALVNFESGNWFNAVAPEPRDVRLWDGWRRLMAEGGLVLSSSLEADRHARQFYHALNPANLRFEVWPPPINSLAADAAAGTAKDGSVVVFTREADLHKGSHDLQDLDPAVLAGRTLHVVSGGRPEEAFQAALRARFEPEGVEVAFHQAIPDAEKFALISAAQAVLFPSYFEGFGYPPLEAAYAGTECACYDLPVLRESAAEWAHFAPRGNVPALGEALAAALAREERRPELRAAVKERVGIDAAATRLHDILLRSREAVAPAAHRDVGAVWGPFASDAPDAAIGDTGPFPPLLRNLARTPAGDLLASFVCSTRGAVEGLGVAGAELEDVHVRLLDVRGPWRVSQITALLPGALEGQTSPLSVLGAEGIVLTELTLQVERAEPMPQAWLALNALEVDAAGSRLEGVLSADGAVDRVAATSDGRVWHEVEVDAEGRCLLALDEPQPQRSGLTLYLFSAGVPVAVLGGMPPVPGGRRQRRACNVRGAAPEAFDILDLTDAQWRRGIARAAPEGAAGLVGCVAPESGTLAPGDFVRVNLGPVRRVEAVRPREGGFDLVFATALNPRTESHPGQVRLVRPAAGVPGVTPSFPASAINWRGPVWVGAGPLSGHCVLVCAELFTPFAGEALDTLALVDRAGRVRTIEQVFDLGATWAVWLDAPVLDGFTIDNALIPAPSARVAGLVFAPDADPAQWRSGVLVAGPQAGRRVRLVEGARVAAGDALVFAGSGLRRVMAVTQGEGYLELSLDLAVEPQADGAPAMVRPPSFVEALDHGGGGLRHPSPMASLQPPVVSRGADMHRAMDAPGALEEPQRDRPRVLFVSIVPPFPLDRGNRLVTHNLLQHVVAQGFDVDLLLLGDVAAATVAAAFGDRVRVFLWPFPQWEEEPTTATRRRIIRELRDLAGSGPLPEIYRTLIREASTYHPYFIVPDAFARLARALYRAHDYAAMVCNYTQTVRIAQELALVRPLPPVAIVTHDALSRLSLDYEGQAFDTVYRYCAADTEREVLNAVPGAVVVAISDSEVAYFSQIGVANPIVLTEYDGLAECRRHAVPAEAFAARKLVFHGSGNPMNIAAISWFLESCWPRVRAAVPQAQLVVCGAVARGITAPVGGVEVKGILGREALMEELGTCSLAINPTLAGTGLKIKTVEAACLGLPSVCLPPAVEGLEEVAERFCILADTAEAFTAGCIALLTDEERWTGLRESALAFSLERFSETRIYAALDRAMGWDEGVEERFAQPRAPYGVADQASPARVVEGLPAELRERADLAFRLLHLGEGDMALDLLAAVKAELPSASAELRCALAELALARRCPAFALDLAQSILAQAPTHVRALQLAVLAAHGGAGRPAAIAAAKQLALAAPGSPALAEVLRDLDEPSLLGRLSPLLSVPLGLNGVVPLRDLAKKARSLGPGWDQLEPTGALCGGRYAQLLLEFSATTRGLRLNLAMRGEGGAVRLRLLADGTPARTLDLGPETIGVDIPLAPVEAGRSRLKLEFFLSSCGETRPSLRLESVELREQD